MASPKRRALRSRLVYLALVAVGTIVRHLPLFLARLLGTMIGHAGWHVLRRERRRALERIGSAFPDWSQSRRKATIRGMFHHLGQTLFEVLWLPNLDARMMERTTVIDGLEPIIELVRSGSGVVAFTGHCGNWEWLACCVARSGIPVWVLQRERNEAELNRFITAIRATAGIRTIDRGSTGAAREMILALRQGGVLAFLIDQNIRVESVNVPFFGRPTPTPIGPARLAIRTGSPVFSGFIERRGGKQYARFNPPIETDPSDDPVALTALITQEIEEQIRRAPEQWVWMHDRWRVRE